MCGAHTHTRTCAAACLPDRDHAGPGAFLIFIYYIWRIQHTIMPLINICLNTRVSRARACAQARPFTARIKKERKKNTTMRFGGALCIPHRPYFTCARASERCATVLRLQGSVNICTHIRDTRYNISESININALRRALDTHTRAPPRHYYKLL